MYRKDRVKRAKTLRSDCASKTIPLFVEVG